MQTWEIKSQCSLTISRHRIYRHLQNSFFLWSHIKNYGTILTIAQVIIQDFRFEIWTKPLCHTSLLHIPCMSCSNHLIVKVCVIVRVTLGINKDYLSGAKRIRLRPSVICSHAKHIPTCSIPRRLIIVTKEIFSVIIRWHAFYITFRLYFGRNSIACQLISSLNILLNSRIFIQLIVDFLFNTHLFLIDINPLIYSIRLATLPNIDSSLFPSAPVDVASLWRL